MQNKYDTFASPVCVSILFNYVTHSHKKKPKKLVSDQVIDDQHH